MNPRPLVPLRGVEELCLEYSTLPNQPKPAEHGRRPSSSPSPYRAPRRKSPQPTHITTNFRVLPQYSIQRHQLPTSHLLPLVRYHPLPYLPRLLRQSPQPILVPPELQPKVSKPVIKPIPKAMPTIIRPFYGKKDGKEAPQEYLEDLEWAYETRLSDP